MELGLKAKVVMVTGGTRGIGLARTRAFLAEGARDAVFSRSKENVDQACSELKELVGVVADLSDEQAALDAVETVEKELGPIDVLVNSAGAAKRTPLDELTPAHYRAAMEAMFYSYINVIDPIIIAWPGGEAAPLSASLLTGVTDTRRRAIEYVQSGRGCLWPAPRSFLHRLSISG